ncbi:1,4-alpha-glucan branching protein GlgB [Planomicrobium sp. Y74]|uniref:1,4-alpha-glucan branching protein GlgB n=1 Tax=Planomicrobium sp. Y74 TaxID=2478977 RepID=UPI000EF5484C|nr:1,4-alpha-glucan branching protein GlgB [Planomicrobium sp. Y74]RLQ90894.1 1,4-alpha-glucan branching protein GlgB [Planomicrobium sp. Y74]
MIIQDEELTAEKLKDFHEGRMTDAYRYFGVKSEEGHTSFTLWVPEVEKVTAVVFNPISNERNSYEMNRLPYDETVWQTRVPGDLTGYSYIYELLLPNGELLEKSDPYARQGEMRPQTKSVIAEPSRHKWQEAVMREKKTLAENHVEKPMAIYELHIGTWKRNEQGGFLTYRELADELVPYVKNLGFTHIEILPITEHPLDESWGYQATGYFAPTIRYGTADDLKYFVSVCAENGIGLFLDWIPGHFCSDAFALSLFNGKPLYEESREERRVNHDWGTLNFDIRKGEVVSFLLSSAHYWLDEFKFDGFRMDAVITQLFIPNEESRPFNAEGKGFLRNLVSGLKRAFPDSILIAEDAWGHPKVTHTLEDNGVGFDYKWNFGWMHDTLAYMKEQPSERSEHHEKMNFSLMYQYDERYILAFSHDEVVHGEKSLLNKLPGTIEEKFSQLRLLLGFWITHPGKKLLFMGQEFGHFDEWEFKPELDWASLETDAHQRMAYFTKDLLAFYKGEVSLYQLDDHPKGFTWLDADNHEQSVASFIRRGKNPEGDCIVLCNFSNHAYPEFRVGVPGGGEYEQVFSSAAAEYGGVQSSMTRTAPAEGVSADGQERSIKIELPAFTMCIWKSIEKGSEAD